ncbi:hypothetical protein LTR37_015750 [Vermiconidia calcicola]|uniref:Uncharacterized protein n=1 Tax=Vermiconidia calcicola TaxID=1690605 RepID=A0ACC3MRC2_9PEZI|nr:hypothetical protein LTR37_015750 [Vermiconidia calcicola]
MLGSAARYLALLPLAIEWAHCTQVQTFSDSECEVSLNDWEGPNGYPGGLCTSALRQGNYSSFMITALDPGCAITLYGPGTPNGPCSPNAAPGAIVADPAKCYNTTWAYYSIDGCFKSATRSGKKSTESSSRTSTSTFPSPSTSTSTSSRTDSTGGASRASSTASASPSPDRQNNDDDDGTNTGAIVGSTIGGVAFGALLAALGIWLFIRSRRARRDQLPSYPGGPAELPPSEYHSAARKDLVGGAHYTGLGGHPVSPGGNAHELSSHGIPEMQSRHLVELPGNRRSDVPKGEAM